jgi:hypothetical protein
MSTVRVISAAYSLEQVALGLAYAVDPNNNTRDGKQQKKQKGMKEDMKGKPKRNEKKIKNDEQAPVSSRTEESNSTSNIVQSPTSYHNFHLYRQSLPINTVHRKDTIYHQVQMTYKNKKGLFDVLRNRFSIVGETYR